jgi:hypothetical protein
MSTSINKLKNGEPSMEPTEPIHKVRQAHLCAAAATQIWTVVVKPRPPMYPRMAAPEGPTHAPCPSKYPRIRHHQRGPWCGPPRWSTTGAAHAYASSSEGLHSSDSPLVRPRVCTEGATHHLWEIRERRPSRSWKVCEREWRLWEWEDTLTHM